MKPYIFIARKLPEDIIQKLVAEFDVHMWEHEDLAVPAGKLVEEAKKADAIVTMLTDQVDKSVLKAGEKLKVVANMAVGYDNINVKLASERGVAICNTPDVLTDTTADLAFTLMMAAARRVVEAAEYVKQGKWKSWSPLLLAGNDIHHKTVGIVGMGKIGEAVAKRAGGFDMEILYHNRSRKPVAEKKVGAAYCSFEELLKKSDFVVCLTPLTEETKGLFTREAFKQMKKTAVFVNASRGPIVDEKALYEALKNGEIAAAGLDVFENEPIGADHPLLDLPNVIALPHIGSSSIETRKEMMQLCIDNVHAVLTGKEPLTLVNKDWKQNG